MKCRSLPLGAILFLSALAVHAATTDDMLIKSDRFNNGWNDSWSWLTTRYATNNPVFDYYRIGQGTKGALQVDDGQK